MDAEELSRESLTLDECAGRLRLAYGVGLCFTLLGLAFGLLAHGAYHSGAQFFTVVLTAGTACCAAAVLKATADVGYYGRVKRHIDDRRRARGAASYARPAAVTYQPDN